MMKVRPVISSETDNIDQLSKALRASLGQYRRDLIDAWTYDSLVTPLDAEGELDELDESYNQEIANTDALIELLELFTLD